MVSLKSMYLSGWSSGEYSTCLCGRTSLGHQGLIGMETPKEEKPSYVVFFKELFKIMHPWLSGESICLLSRGSCVRIAPGVQKDYSLKYMGELHTVLYKSDIVLTDTVLNQVSRQVPDCNKFPPTIYLAGRV